VASSDANRIRTRFDYWVRGEGGVLREHSETFWMWPAPRTQVVAELREPGFTPLPERAHPGVPGVRLERRRQALWSTMHVMLCQLVAW
jgi:hypothetical protein